MQYSMNAPAIVLCLFLIGAVAMILYLYGRDKNTAITKLQQDIERQDGLAPLDRLTLRLEAARLQASDISWIEKALSAMGVLAFVATFGALIIQAVQNNALQQKSDQEESQRDLLQKQADRAKSLLQPVVGSVIRNFDQNGTRPSYDEKELLSFAVDQWLTAPETDEKYRENLKNAFRAALIVRDYSAALDAANKLGRDFPETNPAEQISLFEYAYITGYGRAEKERIRALLNAPRKEITPGAALRLIAVARATGLIEEQDAIDRASRASGLPTNLAAGRLQELGMRLRQSRDAVLTGQQARGRPER